MSKKAIGVFKHILETHEKQISYWKDFEGNVYLDWINEDKTTSTYMLNNKNADTRSLIFEIFEKNISTADINEVIDLMYTNANRLTKTRHKPCIRVGIHEDTLYINLLREDHPFVAVTADGWEFTKTSPVKFINSSSALPMALPSKTGNIKDLGKILNYGKDENLMIMAAWLIGAFHPAGPYVMLCVNGQQGSAKSTNSRFLRSLIDPNSNTLREPPTNMQDFRAIVRNNHVVALDNVSYIKNDFSDNLCRLAYGEAIGGRKLYTDYDDAAFSAARPILLNGIPDLGERPDLIDRMININLPKIEIDSRTGDTEIKQRFREVEGSILGGILDHLVHALKNYHDTEVTFKPRMVEFARWAGSAFKGGLSWDAESFFTEYSGMITKSSQDTAETDEVVQAILKALDAGVKLNGKSGEVMSMVADYKGGAEQFPRSVRAWGNYLRRIDPLLSDVGIRVQYKVKKDDGQTKRFVIIEKL